MKKLLLTLTLVACALAVQAGETKDNNTKASTTPKAECSAAKMKEGNCSACCKAETKKQVVMSPKAAADKRT